MTIMSKNPRNYGLDDIISEEPLVYDTVELNAAASLSLIADLTGEPASAIKELNPALLRDVAPAGDRLHVPEGSLAALQAGLELIPADKRLAWRVHRTEAGEDLAAVARKYGTSPDSLASTNAGLTATLEPGSLVVVPAAPPRPPVAAATRSRATSLQALRQGSSPLGRLARPCRRQASCQTRCSRQQSRSGPQPLVPRLDSYWRSARPLCEYKVTHVSADLVVPSPR
jgi:LysM repeat protein